MGKKDKNKGKDKSKAKDKAKDKSGKKGLFAGSNASKKAKSVDRGAFRKQLVGNHKATITSNYFWIADSGAKMMTFTFDVDGSEHKEMFCLFSGDKTNNRNYWVNQKTKEETLLPGYEIVDAICRNILKKGVESIESLFKEKKVNVYNSRKGKEVPTSVPVLTKLIGAEVVLNFKRQAQDIPLKNNGKIVLKKNKRVPSGKFFVESIIGKVYDSKHRTQSEIANKSKAKFYKQAEKNDDYVNDRTDKKKWSKTHNTDGSLKKGSKGKKKGKKGKVFE